MARVKFEIKPTGEEKEWEVTMIREHFDVKFDEEGQRVVINTKEETHFKTINLQQVPLVDVNKVFIQNIEEFIYVADRIVIYGDVKDA
jgi:hypothetical protein